MIYTSYLSNVKNLPKDVVPIAICGGQITGWKYPRYSKLAPKWKFFSEWKKTHDNDYYIEHFNAEVLSVLNQRQVVEDLMRLSENKDVALICYERPEAFCHRHLVADWLRKAGYEVEEYSAVAMNYIKLKQEYETFKLKWMINHGYTLYDLMESLERYTRDEIERFFQRKEKHFDELDINITTIFPKWELECGFNGSVYPCFEEWLENDRECEQE